MYPRFPWRWIRPVVFLLILSAPSLAGPLAHADDQDPSALYGRWDWISMTSTPRSSASGGDPNVSTLTGTLDLNPDATFQEQNGDGSLVNNGAGTFTISDDQLRLEFDPSYALDPATYTYSTAEVNADDETYQGLSLREDYSDGTTALYLLYRE